MFTKAFFKHLMERNQNARPTECTILAHCQTRVFEFPRAHISTAHPLRPAIIVERQGARATVVSDVTDYFQNHTPFGHFRKCGVLRSRIDEAISESKTNATPDWFPLFVIIEQETPCETQLETGTCCIVDQGEYFGGTKGEDAVIAFRVIGGAWPELDENDTWFVNFVLATIKIIQGEIGAIREIVGSSCFIDDQHRAVYPWTISGSANLSSSSRLTEIKLTDKLCELRKLAHAIEREHSKNKKCVDALVDALRLEIIETNHYRCAWYLSLYQTLWDFPTINRNDLRKTHGEYRNLIAHPKPDTKITKMDMNKFGQLQSDGIAFFKKYFLDT